MPAMSRRTEFLDHVLDQLAAFGPVTARPMFGAFGLYSGEVMFALVAADALYFKADARNRPDFEAAGMEPFTYRGKGGRRTALSYFEVPADVLEDGDRLARWADKAVGAAHAALKAKGRGGRRRAK